MSEDAPRKLNIILGSSRAQEVASAPHVKESRRIDDVGRQALGLLKNSDLHDPELRDRVLADSTDAQEIRGVAKTARGAAAREWAAQEGVHVLENLPSEAQLTFDGIITQRAVSALEQARRSGQPFLPRRKP